MGFFFEGSEFWQVPADTFRESGGGKDVRHAFAFVAAQDREIVFLSVRSQSARAHYYSRRN